MRAILAAVLGATVVNTLLTWSVIYHHSPSGPIVGHDDIMRALVRDELTRHQEKVRVLVNDELMRSRCSTLLHLSGELPTSAIDTHCWRDHWTAGEVVE